MSMTRRCGRSLSETVAAVWAGQYCGRNIDSSYLTGAWSNLMPCVPSGVQSLVNPRAVSPSRYLIHDIEQPRIRHATVPRPVTAQRLANLTSVHLPPTPLQFREDIHSRLARRIQHRPRRRLRCLLTPFLFLPLLRRTTTPSPLVPPASPSPRPPSLQKPPQHMRRLQLRVPLPADPPPAVPAPQPRRPRREERPQPLVLLHHGPRGSLHLQRGGDAGALVGRDLVAQRRDEVGLAGAGALLALAVGEDGLGGLGLFSRVSAWRW